MRQKKYEVLDNKNSLNGVVTITTVRNLQSSSEFNLNEVEFLCPSVSPSVVMMFFRMEKCPTLTVLHLQLLLYKKEIQKTKIKSTPN